MRSSIRLEEYRLLRAEMFDNRKYIFGLRLKVRRYTGRMSDQSGRRPPAQTLSAHLLREAGKFRVYPYTQPRTKRNLKVQQVDYAVWRLLIEWKKTFGRRTDNGIGDGLSQVTDAFVDELYCWELLHAVPDFVTRTRKLARVLGGDVSQSNAIIYLREATTCYIYGLPQAAVALARAAVEARIRHKARQVIGTKLAKELKLSELLADRRLESLLSSIEKKALFVNDKANSVLHLGHVATSEEALKALDAARSVLALLG
jgi:hypothetical protein